MRGGGEAGKGPGRYRASRIPGPLVKERKVGRLTVRDDGKNSNNDDDLFRVVIKWQAKTSY